MSKCKQSRPPITSEVIRGLETIQYTLHINKYTIYITYSLYNAFSIIN